MKEFFVNGNTVSMEIKDVNKLIFPLIVTEKDLLEKKIKKAKETHSYISEDLIKAHEIKVRELEAQLSIIDDLLLRATKIMEDKAED